MGQSKSGKTKESAKEKKQRRKEQPIIQKQIRTIVVPALVVIFVLIVAYVYVKTRPKTSYMDMD